MTKGNKGDLVYIPSSVTIYQVDESWSGEMTETAVWVPGAHAAIRRWRKTEKPMNVLCIGDAAEGYKKIIYESEPWWVRDKDVYNAKRS